MESVRPLPTISVRMNSMNPSKPLIAVVAGGYSGEREVSLRSAATIIKHIDTTRYTPYLVRISEEAWEVEVDGSWLPLDRNQFAFTHHGETHRLRYAFITIHGTPGENGLLQGYLDMLQIPYNTGGVLCEALTFDKFTCNHYLSAFGIRIATSERLYADMPYNVAELSQRIPLPVFVKPNVGGSSIATTKVTSIDQLEGAIQKAFGEAPEVLVERLIEGTEVTSGCYITQNTPHPLPLTEVVVKKGEFFDFDAKYYGNSEEITPARISEELTQQLQQLTCEIAHLLHAQGIIRVDYIIEPDGQPTLLEVNTTPGMTETSFIPQEVHAAGLELTAIFTAIINDKLHAL